MKQKLLLFILPMLLLTTLSYSQDHVWDFGNDTTNWPLNPTELTVDTTVDGLTQVPGGGTGFGIVEANSSSWGDGYTSVNRWKSGGNSGIDPSGGVDFLPTRRYLTFPISGPVAVKIWFKQSGTSLPRALWVTDGSAEVTHFDSTGDGSSQYIEANYTGGAGNLYVFFAGNAFNLYKLEISSTLLGTNDFKSTVSTNIKSIGNRIYVSNVKTSTEVNIYSITGALVKSFKTNTDIDFNFKTGLWIASVKTVEGQKAVKLVTY